MEKLNRDEIVKALECCHTPIAEDCEECPYRTKGGIKDNFYTGCCNELCKDALTLINQLSEENTKLANLLFEKDVIILEQGKFVEENERLKTELRKTAQKLKAVEEANEKLRLDLAWIKRKGD